MLLIPINTAANGTGRLDRDEACWPSGTEAVMAGMQRAKDRVRVIEVAREDALCVAAWHAMDLLCERARLHRRVVAMLVVDRYSHSYRAGAWIDPRIRDARELLLRFETGLPDPATLACEPHSIGVAELRDRFVLSTTVSRHTWINEAVGSWLHGLHGLRAGPRQAQLPAVLQHGADSRTNPVS